MKLFPNKFEQQYNPRSDNLDLYFWLPFVHTAMEQKLGVVVLKHSYLIGAAIGFDICTPDSQLQISRSQVKKMPRRIVKMFQARKEIHGKFDHVLSERPQERGIGVVDFAIAVDDTVFGDGVDILLGKLYRTLSIQKGYEYFIGTTTNEAHEKLLKDIHGDAFNVSFSMPFSDVSIADADGNKYLGDEEGDIRIFYNTNSATIRNSLTKEPVEFKQEEKKNDDDSSSSIEIIKVPDDESSEENMSLSMEE